MRRVLALALLALVVTWSSPSEARRRHPRRPPPPPPVRVVHPHPHPVHVVVLGPVPRVVVAAEPCPGPDLVWVGGHPGPGGHWVAGHCARVGAPPRVGWVYVSGYWNGAVWVSGFWRPDVRVGFRWVEARVTEEGEYQPGYWEPEGGGPEGTIWRPGYWDGARWVEGGWVPSSQYQTYGPDGELTFFAVGDGQIEDVALPAEGGGDAAIQDAGFEVTAEDGSPVRHSEVPE